MKCDTCEHLKMETIGCGPSFLYCSMEHWEGGPIQEMEKDPWEECKDFKPREGIKMEINNLLKEQMETLESKVKEMQKDNPDQGITYKVFRKDITDFSKELTVLIGKHKIDSRLNLPNFIIAEYLANCLDTLLIFQSDTNRIILEGE